MVGFQVGQSFNALSEAVIVLGGLAFMTLMSLSHGRDADLMDDLDERGKGK